MDCKNTGMTSRCTLSLWFAVLLLSSMVLCSGCAGGSAQSHGAGAGSGDTVFSPLGDPSEASPDLVNGPFPAIPALQAFRYDSGTFKLVDAQRTDATASCTHWVDETGAPIASVTNATSIMGYSQAADVSHYKLSCGAGTLDPTFDSGSIVMAQANTFTIEVSGTELFLNPGPYFQGLAQSGEELFLRATFYFGAVPIEYFQQTDPDGRFYIGSSAALPIFDWNEGAMVWHQTFGAVQWYTAVVDPPAATTIDGVDPGP